MVDFKLFEACEKNAIFLLLTSCLLFGCKIATAQVTTTPLRWNSRKLPLAGFAVLASTSVNNQWILFCGRTGDCTRSAAARPVSGVTGQQPIFCSIPSPANNGAFPSTASPIHCATSCAPPIPNGSNREITISSAAMKGYHAGSICYISLSGFGSEFEYTFRCPCKRNGYCTCLLDDARLLFV